MFKLKHYIFGALLLSLCSLDASAQNKSKKLIRRPAVVENKVSTQELMAQYRFDEAVTALQKELRTSGKNKRPTEMVESELRQARLGASMLQGTERVTIVDSLVVGRGEFLAAYKLSADCGRIGDVATLAGLSRTQQGGEVAFLNSLGDRLFYAAPDSSALLKIVSRDKFSDAWTEAAALNGMGEADEVQDYPFMLADGVTLYYAAQGSESLGGYDIFVTRYNKDSGEFLKSENVGMPFNSPANDYMLAIDETTGVGWFVSDRNQPADSVCIYRFIPNDTREVYDITAENAEEVRRIARLSDIALCQTDTKAVNEAKARLAAVPQTSSNESGSDFRFVVNDNVVYTAYSQFRSYDAAGLAQTAAQNRKRLNETLSALDELRRKYHKTKNADTASKIRIMESSVNALTESIKTTENEARRKEQKALGL